MKETKPQEADDETGMPAFCKNCTINAQNIKLHFPVGLAIY